VTSEDAMTADWARLPHELLERISSRIIAEVHGVHLVAFRVSSKPRPRSSGSDDARTIPSDARVAEVVGLGLTDAAVKGGGR